MPLKDLIEVMEPPVKPVDSEGDWIAVEEALSTPLPQDYKNFIAIYGSGSINGFLSIFNPFAQDENLNLFRQIEMSRSHTERLVHDFLERLPEGVDPAQLNPLLYSLFPPLDGFLPWGRAQNGQWCDWMTSHAPPDAWAVARRIERGYQSFGLPFADFLVQLVDDDRYDHFPMEMSPWPKPEFLPPGKASPHRRKRPKSAVTIREQETPHPRIAEAELGPPVGTVPPRILPVGLTAAFPEIPVGTAVRLNPRPTVTTVDASKVGGELLWPAGEPWPRCAEHEVFVPILQLRAVDVPEVGFPSKRDLFQLLWCPKLHADHGYGPLVRAFWRAAREVDAVQATPEPVTHFPGFVPSECEVWPDRVEELPAVQALDRPIAARLEGWLSEHWSRPVVDGSWLAQEEYPSVVQIAASPVSKVGGHPHWIQDPEQVTCSCGHEMEHLLTIASSEIDPSGWRPPPEIGQGVPATSQTQQPDDPLWAPDDLDTSPPFPDTELMLGDLGSVYVFICRHCDSWPVDSVIQTH